MNIDEYGETVLQDVLSVSEATGCSALEAFTELVAERLSAAGDFEEPQFAYHKKTGVEISGWALDADTGHLHAFVTVWSQDATLPTLTATQVGIALRRLSTFLDRCQNNYVSNLEESDPVWELADLLSRPTPDISAIRLYVFSNHVVRRDTTLPFEAEVCGKPAEYQVWDLDRLYRYDTSGLEREPIAVNICEVLGRPLECLQVETSEAKVFLAIVPGRLLADLYGTFGSRLLERNVRSFLQARGNVNRGIRDSLMAQPGRFLAYNNGISATAADVSVIDLPDGGSAITEIKDLQIVNGGQTTASMYHAVQKDRADLSEVYVQAKITVVGAERIDQIVPLISRYSNTQNKVTGADFSANHPFHVQVEELSRTIWAPSADGTQKQTRWFYERARGQYADEVSRAGTPARQRQFKINCPQNQKFTKPDLAKFMNTWDQWPHIVSLGAEKNFLNFMSRVDERPVDLDVQWFHRLIAKGILYRSTEKLVRRQQAGYYAQNVAYTLSKLYHTTQHRLDLEIIWRQQRITEATIAAVTELSDLVQNVILNPVGRHQHIGEWCKKLDCWTHIREIHWDVPAALRSELVDVSGAAAVIDRTDADAPTVTQLEALSEIEGIAGETWFALSKWAKDTGNLQGWQRRLAYSLGKLVSEGGMPSPKQAVQGRILFTESVRLGFNA